MLRFTFLIGLAISAMPAFAQQNSCGNANLVPETSYCLAGTTVIGSGGMALFKADNQTLSIKSGETIGSWRLIAIRPGAVTIRRGAVSRELTMNRISTAGKIAFRHAPAGELHDISPVAAGRASSVGTVGPSGKRLSISAHLPPVQEY